MPHILIKTRGSNSLVLICNFLSVGRTSISHCSLSALYSELIHGALSTARLGNDVGLEWGHIKRKINFDRRKEKDSF